jgi:hypothetical protein
MPYPAFGYGMYAYGMYRVAHMYLNDFRMPLGELGVMVRQF